MRSVCSVIITIIVLFVTSGINLPAEVYQTAAEKSQFQNTSLYHDVMDLLFWAQKKSASVKLITLAKSFAGRTIPLVVLSQSGIASPIGLKATNKAAILVQANIHSGELEGKEAVLMFIRDVAMNRHTELLTSQTILIIPNLNVDGNEKLAARNRRDNGPELAGVRHNGQNLDLNRDFLKLESPEISGLIEILNKWDPIVFLDLHTKNGSYHREPITYTTLSNPNSSQLIRDYMWHNFFPEVQKTLNKKYGFDSIPYGNFVNRADPDKGWINNTTGARFGTNYVGLRNRITILNENYPHAPYKTRVLSCYGFLKSVLEYTNTNINQLKELVYGCDRETAAKFHTGAFVLESKIGKLFDLTVKSYKFVNEKIKSEDRKKYPPWYGDYIVKKTKTNRDYHIPYFAQAEPKRTRPLPRAYLIPPGYESIIRILKKHGIVISRIKKSVSIEVEEFKLKTVQPEKRLYQGRVFINISGEYQKQQLEVKANSFYVSMKQPLARLIAVLLEPDYQDSLAYWGFFNKILVTQWGSRPNFYPVYRLAAKNPDLEMIADLTH